MYASAPKNLREQIEAALPADLLHVIAAAGDIAVRMGYRLYAAGGFVRDLLLGGPTNDLDLVVEGDAITLARGLAAQFGGAVEAHGRFGTASWDLSGSTIGASALSFGIGSLDFAMARREVYASPAALPQVQRGSIEADLERRDFTINTMAVCLDSPCFGDLIDPFGGARDLAAGQVRVLHHSSFIDDPTRILRAVRYEQRFGFCMDAATAVLATEGIKYIPRLSGERLANELFVILAESMPERAMRRLEELNVLEAIHPEFRLDGGLEWQFARLRSEFGRPRPITYLAVLLYRMTPDAVSSIVRRLRLTKSQIQLVEHLSRLARLEPELGGSTIAPSKVVRLLESSSDELLSTWAALVDSEHTRDTIRQYRTNWRHVRPVTGGKRLMELGIAPGPIYRTILERLRDMRLDGEIETTDQEEGVALRLAAQAREET